MNTVKRSLEQLLGRDYTDAVTRAAAALGVLEEGEARRLAKEEVEFFPEAFAEKLDGMLPRVGEQIAEGLGRSAPGAATRSFDKAANRSASPLAGLGYYRAGEDGRLYLAAKSEHYHASVGHRFPGYRLLENASRLGIPNATHNNTRGHITRLAEQELVRTANGIARGDDAALSAALQSEEPRVLNRVINLETGSLAVEAALKMMLARFFRLERASAEPPHAGKTPVFFVMADRDGGSEANYHGTTITAQTLRGMWPGLAARIEGAGIYKVCAVEPNNIGDFAEKLRQHSRGEYRPAGFLHEIVLMNYGGLLLDRQYLRQAYGMCHEAGVPVLVDEIQSCMWVPELFLFRQYGLDPDFVILGKGFPGGQYAASKVLTTAAMDTLSQFGALVTNGQEELAALAYLVTMEFVQENGEHLREVSEYFERSLRALAARHPGVIACVQGLGLLAALYFNSNECAAAFARALNRRCVDISSQTYKANCPPAVLLKPPVIVSHAYVDALTKMLEEALAGLGEETI